MLHYASLKIDVSARKVLLDGKELVFPRKELDILTFLVRHPGVTFSRAALLKEVWGAGVYVGIRTIDVHIRRIRERLGKHSGWIESVKGEGYRLKE